MVKNTSNKFLSCEQVEKLLHLNRKFVIDNIEEILDNIKPGDAYYIYDIVDDCEDYFWKYAVNNKILEIIEMELEFGHSPNRCHGYALKEASRNGDYEMVKLLLKWNVDVTFDDNYALRFASVDGHLGIVELLLQHGLLSIPSSGGLKYIGVDIHAQDDYALRGASRNGHLDVVKLLLQNGANVHADNDGALIDASEYGYLKVVKVLLQHGSYIHSRNDNALRVSSANGHFEVVKLLLQKGANIHACNDNALRWASDNGHSEVVKVLLRCYKICDNLDKILDMKLFDIIDEKVEFVDENHENGIKIKEHGAIYLYKEGKKIKNEKFFPVSTGEGTAGKSIYFKMLYPHIYNKTDDLKENTNKRSVHDKTFLWACQRKSMKLIKNLVNNEFDQEILFEALVNCYSNNCVELFEYIIKNYNYDKEIIKERLLEHVLDNENDNSESFFNILYDDSGSKTSFEQL